jgi:phage shock protein C
MNNRFYKSNRDIMISGVCGGIAEYFNWDPSIVRIISALIVLGTGWGLIAYIVAAVVVPKGPY